MPSIGLGFDGEALETEMKKLAIKPERVQAIMEIISGFDGSLTPIDRLKQLIRTTTRANELAFLSFVFGVGTGMGGAIAAMGASQRQPTMADMLQKAMIVGAEHADEIKQQLGITGETPEATAAAKKKKEEEEKERMYQ
jgi:hypothetical protein